VQPNISTVLLVTDPEHAVPVMLKRNGVRMIASGMGRNDLLDVINVPLSTDIKPGDVVVTSGLGGRFAPGLPVGVVTRVRADDSRAFLLGDIRPAARLDRGSQVMIVTSTYRATAPVAVTAASGSGAAATATAPAATTTPAAATPTDASTTQPTLLRDPSVPPAPKPQLKAPETEKPAVPSP
jgi:rod shape-determining protein MreC